MIKTLKRRGEKVIAIHLTFRNRTTGAQERYRRDAQVQTQAGARSEEQRITSYFVDHGTIAPLLVSTKPANVKKVDTSTGKTWADAVKRLKEVGFASLKPSTRRGYEELLHAPAFKGWDSISLSEINFSFIEEWDAKLAKATGPSRRRNFHVVLRSALRAAVRAKHIPTMPALPPLPEVTSEEIGSPDPEDVERLLTEQDTTCGVFMKRKRKAARLAFAVAAWAGLRSGEVRALQWRDVDLRARRIHVRRALSANEMSVPKSKQGIRTVSIPKRLVEMLQEAALKPHKLDSFVCVRDDGKPWGESGIIQALRRACTRLGIEGRRYHALRHYFVTTLFSSGADSITIMKMVGHADLETTEGYADFMQRRGDDAVANAFDRGNGVATVDHAAE